jgi:hypothetical protein
VVTNYAACSAPVLFVTTAIVALGLASSPSHDRLRVNTSKGVDDTPVDQPAARWKVVQLLNFSTLADIALVHCCRRLLILLFPRAQMPALTGCRVWMNQKCWCMPTAPLNHRTEQAVQCLSTLLVLLLAHADDTKHALYVSSAGCTLRAGLAAT